MEICGSHQYFKLFLPRTSLIEIRFFFDRSWAYIAKQVVIEKRKRLVGIETVRLVTVGQKQQRISLCHTGCLFFSQPTNTIYISISYYIIKFSLCHTGSLFFARPTNTVDIWCLYCMIIYIVSVSSYFSPKNNSERPVAALAEKHP